MIACLKIGSKTTDEYDNHDYEQGSVDGIAAVKKTLKATNVGYFTEYVSLTNINAKHKYHLPFVLRVSIYPISDSGGSSRGTHYELATTN